MIRHQKLIINFKIKTKAFDFILINFSIKILGWDHVPQGLNDLEVFLISFCRELWFIGKNAVFYDFSIFFYHILIFYFFGLKFQTSNTIIITRIGKIGYFGLWAPCSRKAHFEKSEGCWAFKSALEKSNSGWKPKSAKSIKSRQNPWKYGKRKNLK